MYCFWLHNWLKKTSSFTKSDQEIEEMDCLKLRCVMFCHVEMFLCAFPDVGDDVCLVCWATLCQLHLAFSNK